jgi:hypothetical protein
VSFMLTILAFVLGLIIILVSNPLQFIPRYFFPIRHVVVERVVTRWRAEWHLRRWFWLLTALSAAQLALAALVSLAAPATELGLLLRMLCGFLVGGTVGFTLLRRQEVIIGDLGIIGLYPNPRLVVSWRGLAGYAVDDARQALLLVNQAGEAVEAMPLPSEARRIELELALMQYLPKLDIADVSPHRLPTAVRHRLLLAVALLALGAFPLLSALYGLVSDYPISSEWWLLAAVAGVLAPYIVMDSSYRQRLVHYSQLGHVYFAELRTHCLRCYYQALCWQSGLQKQIRWRRGGAALLPTWEEFSRQQQHPIKVTREEYQICCQCLITHLQEKDIYQISLRPLAGQVEQDSTD